MYKSLKELRFFTNEEKMYFTPYGHLIVTRIETFDET